MGNHKRDIKEKYEKALKIFVEKIKKDSNIVAVFSYGSMVKDNLWEKSDIDIWLISKENNKKMYLQYSLVEDDIDFQVELYSRNYFIELVDSPLNQNFFRTVLPQSNLLYCEDETIEKLFNEDKHLGDRDKEEKLLISAVYAVICMKKAEKFLKFNNDMILGFNVIQKLVQHLATIEVALKNQFPSMEVENQALNLNYDFFKDVYVDLINNKVDISDLENKLVKCKEYLEEKKDVVLEPIVKWLREDGEIKGVSEINEYIKRKYNISNDGNELTDTYNWLAEKDILIKTSESIKLLNKSKIFLEEAAYYYNFDNDMNF